MLSIRRAAMAAAALGLVSLLAAPSSVAITGGTEDLNNTHSSVGLVVFYQPEGRFRCSGSLIAPRVVLTAGHCTFGDIGMVVVTFDPEIARTVAEAEANMPRAADDSGPEDAKSTVGYTAGDITAPKYIGAPTWFLGTPRTHPTFGGIGANDTGVVILDEAPGLPVATLAPPGYLEQFRGSALPNTEFLAVGYGTEIRQPDDGAQRPISMGLPVVRRYTTEVGQRLTGTGVLLTNGNEHDTRGGGGTCFGDSGGPLLHGGFVVAELSFGRNQAQNCRYIAGYQRVDVPVVRNWLVDCTTDLDCPTKPE